MEIEGLRNQIRDNVRITIDPKIFLAEGESEDEMPATVNIDQSIDIIVTGKKEAFNAIATVNDELALQGKAAPTVEKALQALLETSAELLGYYIEKLDDSHLQLPATGGGLQFSSSARSRMELEHSERRLRSSLGEAKMDGASEPECE